MAPWDHSLKTRLLLRLLGRRGATILRLQGTETAADLALVQSVRRHGPLLVPDAAALQILACVRASVRLNGAMAEAGVFAGGTAELICEAKGGAPLHLFDVFETLQADGAFQNGGEEAADIRGRFKKLHSPQSVVERRLAKHSGVTIHAGVFPGSAEALSSLRFSFVHLDLDLERSTRAALEFFYPRLLAGGILVGDDYQDAGVRRGFAGYFSAHPDVLIAQPWGTALVVKAAA
jgi:O-methyltransferase